MRDFSHLEWPFFGEFHRRFTPDLAEWADREVVSHIDRTDVDRSCRALVRALGEAGWLKAVAPAAYGGLSEKLDVRTLCCAREVLAWNDGLADFAFAMQGLGSGPISLFGTDDLKAKYLPPVRDGRHIAAFALSEPEAGSDVGALATTATVDGPAHFRLDGLKTWISNGGIADHYVVFARTGEAPGSKDYLRSLSMPIHRGYRSPGESKSSLPTRLPRCGLTAAASRWPTAWARRATASRWQWRHLTSFDRPLRRRHSVLLAVPSMKHSIVRRRVNCSAHRLRICR